jgi:AmmeMemoRadiSam system protein B
MNVREAVVSGLFYPSDKAELERMILDFDELTDQAPLPLSCIVSPHGSLPYSGRFSVQAWKAAAGQNLTCIVIVAPSHIHFDSGIFLPESSSFTIPTGSIAVDQACVRHLVRKNSRFIRQDIPHLEDHSIEMQLPFLLHFYPGIPIVPIIVSDPDQNMINILCGSLKAIFAHELDTILFVISSNMALDDSIEICNAKTNLIVRGILEKNTESLAQAAWKPHAFCGGVLLAVNLKFSVFSDSRAVLFGIGNSADKRESADEPVVGYASMGFMR